MKRMFIFMILLLMILFAKSQVQTARYIQIDPNVKAFYEYLPAGYATETKKYPLIIVAHGQGELGQGTTASLPNLLKNGLTRHINIGQFPTSFTVNGQTYKFIVISPQFVNWPSAIQLGKIMDYAIANYRVDVSRIYVTGLSMGGALAWDAGYSSVTRARVAAIVPVCGARTATLANGRTIAANNIPVWALHNTGDPTVDVGLTNNWVNYINQSPAPNPAARKTIFNASGHDAWTTSYNPNYRENGRNIYEWMLSYSLVRLPANTAPVVSAGDDQVIKYPLEKTTLTGAGNDLQGAVSFRWSQVSGGAAQIQNPDQEATVVAGLNPGEYVFRLTVMDYHGVTSSDDVRITVR